MALESIARFAQRMISNHPMVWLIGFVITIAKITWTIAEKTRIEGLRDEVDRLERALYREREAPKKI